MLSAAGDARFRYHDRFDCLVTVFYLLLAHRYLGFLFSRVKTTNFIPLVSNATRRAALFSVFFVAPFCFS
jgi:hypothetical protein